MLLRNGIDFNKSTPLRHKVSAKNPYIKSPLNYTGGKYKILNQILPLFPKRIEKFIDLFAGGGNVGINISAKEIYLNDNLIFLIEMFKIFQDNSISKTIDHINERIERFELSLINTEGYNQLRDLYNKDKNPLDLFVLIAYSFNHQIRFNSNHQFNTPFGKNRSSFNKSMESNLKQFISRLQENDIQLSSSSFEKFDLSFLSENDFVYCDPPYLITTGSYNDGKRGFEGWGEKEELLLLQTLDNLDSCNIKFALSNVLEHKGKSNDILKNWLQKKSNYKINYLDFNYANSNYQTIIRDKNASIEVLITNYMPEDVRKNKSLFDELTV